jgi:type IV pilus assembly protein PilY1
VAVRFDNVQVPSLVNLDNAYIEVTPIDTKATGDIKLSILSPISSDEIGNSINNISNRTVVDIINYSITDWRAGEPYRLNISDTLLRHFSRSDWCAGSNLMFVLESPNLSGIEAKETTDGNESKLYVKYDGADSDACGVKTYNDQVNSSSDDGYSYNSDNFITQSTLIAGNGYTTAIRFDSIPLLQGDEIVDARIEFVSALDNASNIEIDVFADITSLNNPEPFINVDGSRITDRNSSLIGGTRIGFGATVRNNKYISGNIAETLNQVVSRGDWSQGNAISLILKSSSPNLKYFYSNDFDLSEAPKLFLRVKQTGSFVGITVRDTLKTIIQEIEPSSGTPTLGSTLETFDYLLGKDVNYGLSRNNNRLKRVSSHKSWTGGETITPENCPEDDPNNDNCRSEIVTGNPVYNTPVSTAVCETNNIIMITDGEPSSNSSVYGRVNNLTGKSCSTEWDCIYDITQHMAEKDHFTNITGVQNIMTNVIGFDFDENSDVYSRLEEYARIGQGQFFNVDDGAGLSSALELITDNILDVETTIATPGVSVNQNNKFQFLNELYYSVFKPSKFKSWSGNLKKYKIVGTDTSGGDFEIIDVNGDPAIDRETGFFREDSQSFWSSDPDGKSVVDGGAASKLINGRNLFTYLDDSIDMKSVSLNNDDYKLRSFNTKLTTSDFNVTESWADSDLEKFLNWVEGQDIFDEDKDGSTTDARTKMGAPLHSQPIVVSYNDNDSTVFVGTNEGFLHGIDALSGKELFAFMPKDMLPNLYKRYRNVVGPHIYGIDNTWIAYRNDADKDGTIGNDASDFVYIYGGMRRGGNSLFSLDVTNVKGSNISSNIHPKVNWIIDSNTSPEFSNLGQSWSVPVLARVKYNGADKVVMIFGGGYDSSHDNPNVINSTDTLGKQVYVIDAISGELLWWASASGTGASEEVTGMNHSITGKVNVIDLDNDGYADYMYVGDLAGQVLKFRINKNNTGESDFADGKIFAKLGKTDGNVDYNFLNNRRIYEKISLVPIENNTEKYMAVVASTGYRAKPLEIPTEDGLFVLKDFEIINDEFDVNETIIIENLLDVTFREDPKTIEADLNDKNGYKIWLIEGTNESGIFLGEKVMGETVVFNNSIIFTTYFPQSKPKACSPVTGVSRSYSINLSNGTPTGLFDNESENLNDETLNQMRYIEQKLPGIASGTKILYTKDGVIALTNTDVKGLGFQSGLGVFKSSWYPKSEKNDVIAPLETPPHLR